MTRHCKCLWRTESCCRLLCELENAGNKWSFSLESWNHVGELLEFADMLRTTRENNPGVPRSFQERPGSLRKLQEILCFADVGLGQ